MSGGVGFSFTCYTSTRFYPRNSLAVPVAWFSCPFGQIIGTRPCVHRYEAVGEESLVAGCPWPWIRHSSLCLRVIETALTWDQAEADCQAKSGHLVSIRSQEMQDLIDLMLIN
ncbi:unnamed protein product, partial [Nesidiocoris tenuis]